MYEIIKLTVLGICILFNKSNFVKEYETRKKARLHIVQIGLSVNGRYFKINHELNVRPNLT